MPCSADSGFAWAVCVVLQKLHCICAERHLQQCAHRSKSKQCAGKSASLIMRKIQPGALQAAKEHHLAEAVAWMRDLTLKDAPLPEPGGNDMAPATPM